MPRIPARIPLALLTALLALAGAAAPAGAASGIVKLDPYFGSGGVVSGGKIMPGFHQAGGLAVTAHRDILLASRGEGGAALARFFPSGDLDSSYAGGVGVLRLPSLEAVGDLSAAADESAFLLSSGTIVTKVTPAGALDESFGKKGSVAIPALDPRFASLHFWSLAAQPDGGVLAAGIRFGSPRMVVVRLLADGKPDPAFGEGGLATIGVGAQGSGAFRLAVLPGGKIVLAGYAQGRPALARLLPDGAPDPSFGRNGRVLAPSRLRGSITALSLRPHGGVIVAGSGWIRGAGEGPDVFLLRYGSGGARDRGFGPVGLLAPVRRYAKPTDVAAIGDRVLVSATGPEPALEAYTKLGRPLSPLAGVAGVPRRVFDGVRAAAQGGKLIFTWTPEHHPAKGEIRLERFLVR